MPTHNNGFGGYGGGNSIPLIKTSEENAAAIAKQKKANEEAKEAKALAKKKYKEQTKELKANIEIFEALKEYHTLLTTARNLYNQAKESKTKVKNEWETFWLAGKTTTDTAKPNRCIPLS